MKACEYKEEKKRVVKEIKELDARLKGTDIATRPLMLGHCECCIHYEVCGVKKIALKLNDVFGNDMKGYNPLTLKCDHFTCRLRSDKHE